VSCAASSVVVSLVTVASKWTIATLVVSEERLASPTFG
jgi:hypothetical protein